MSWKNLKIKTKLILAFGSVLLLITLISGFALYSFHEIGKKASTLNNEVFPISIISNKITLSAFKIASLNQTFSYSLEKEYLDEDRKFLDSLKHYLQLARELTENYSIQNNLTEVVTNSEKSLTQYESVLTGMKINSLKINENKKLIQNIKAEFDDNCKKYTDYQNNILKIEIKNKSSQYRINDRLKRIETFNSAYNKAKNAFNLLISSSSVKESNNFPIAINSLSEAENNLDELGNYSGKFESDQITLVKKNISTGKEIANNNKVSYSELQKFAETSSNFSNALIDNFTTISNNNISLSKKETQNTQDNASISFISIAVGLFLIIILSIVFTSIITKGITSSIKKGILFAKQIAQGNLDAKFEILQKDEIGQLAIALNQMTSKFNAVVAEVIAETNRINFETTKLIEDSSEIYNNLNNQEIVTEMVSISIEQIIKNTKQNKDESNETEQILSKIEEIKNSSGSSISASNSIEQMVEKISSILQTNIVALNAMVDAALAGNQAKIALEVSKLAEKSKFAADEIRKLSKGVTDSESVKMKLEAIIPELEKVAQFIKVHSATTKLDNQNLKELKISMQQHNTLSQQNIDSSENIADSSDRISIISERLKNLVSFFNIAEISEIIKTKNAPKSKISDSKSKSIINRSITKPIETGEIKEEIKQETIETTNIIISTPTPKIQKIKEVTNEKDSKEESIAESVKVIEYTYLSKEKNVYEEQVLETH